MKLSTSKNNINWQDSRVVLWNLYLLAGAKSHVQGVGVKTKNPPLPMPSDLHLFILMIALVSCFTNQNAHELKEKWKNNIGHFAKHFLE